MVTQPRKPFKGLRLRHYWKGTCTSAYPDDSRLLRTRSHPLGEDGGEAQLTWRKGEEHDRNQLFVFTFRKNIYKTYVYTYICVYILYLYIYI